MDGPVGQHRHPRHRLDAAAGDQIGHAAGDLRRRGGERVESRTAQPVDDRARDVVGPAGPDRRGPRDVTALFLRAGADAEDHLVDVHALRGQAVALVQRLHQLPDELVRRHRGQRAAVAAHPPAGRANHVVDIGIQHLASLSRAGLGRPAVLHDAEPAGDERLVGHGRRTGRIEPSDVVIAERGRVLHGQRPGDIDRQRRARRGQRRRTAESITESSVENRNELIAPALRASRRRGRIAAAVSSTGSTNAIGPNTSPLLIGSSSAGCGQQRRQRAAPREFGVLVPDGFAQDRAARGDGVAGASRPVRRSHRTAPRRTQRPPACRPPRSRRAPARIAPTTSS